MRIVRARYAGACYGVERALALVDQAVAAQTPLGTSALTASPTAPPLGTSALTASPTAAPTDSATPVHTLGPLIHNPQVVAELRERGVVEAATVAEVDAGVLVLRSHGVAPQIVEAACEKGLAVVDATCPHVSKAQQAAQELRVEGYTVIVVGERGHPEVEAISAYAGRGALVVQEPSDLPKNLPSQRIGVVVQTTQSAAALEAIVCALEGRGVAPQVRNTICFATRQRQEAAIKLSGEVDAVLVVGGRNSGNTTRLAELCQEVCPRTYHIESPAEIEAVWFTGVRVVGVTAGASTPESQILAVEEALGQL
ncbi:MAG: 4-hydroxy-3-methylbut-2-enyl diphosphate reductase [Coriobacteriales bacterium]|jgi:4-hydroxy-3-methylbut-2-enyl diphosphate reductase|nr:4-hydroxy-3-methylbut-2-enyl diphosphate reductase [Coriobacteriales bacterium]